MTSKKSTTWTRRLGGGILLMVWLALHGWVASLALSTANAVPATTQPAGNAPAKVEVVVARLIYGPDKRGECFAAGFLEVVARETAIKVRRDFASVRLDAEDLFQYPFVVMTGEGAFTLSDKERDNLRDYLNRGGFLLASAGCSNHEWAGSFRAEMKKLFPRREMQALKLDHPVFTTGPYRIATLTAVRETDIHAIYGLEIDGKLRVVFSPLGLNDTSNAGGGCCCCGGNELRNARDINANMLVYALTH